MPRIYDSRSEPHDFCRRCYPDSEREAFIIYGHLGDGPDGRGNCFGYDAEHPPYFDTDYRCELCEERLQPEDDWL